MSSETFPSLSEVSNFPDLCKGHGELVVVLGTASWPEDMLHGPLQTVSSPSCGFPAYLASAHALEGQTSVHFAKKAECLSECEGLHCFYSCVLVCKVYLHKTLCRVQKQFLIVASLEAGIAVLYIPSNQKYFTKACLA